MATCALIIGCPAYPSGTVDDPPPLIERFEAPELPREYPLYESDEIGRLSAEVVSLSNELGEAEAEIERLVNVIESLESDLSEAKAPVKAKESANIYTYEVTAYTAGVESTGKRPGDAGYGVTASGKTVQEGVTAACPPSLAFGTRLKIEGVGERVCHDRGGDIVEGRLDVYIADLQQALKFGRQTLEVEILQ